MQKDPTLQLKNTISENLDLVLNAVEQIDIDHPLIQEEIKKKNLADKEALKEIYKIDNSDSYKRILSFLDFYDTNHTKYSVEAHEGDICSLIAHLLTSDKYLEHINSGSKFNLNEVKRVQKENNQNVDSDLYKKAQAIGCTAGDQILFLTASRLGSIEGVNEKMSVYRCHEGSVSQHMYDADKLWKNFKDWQKVALLFGGEISSFIKKERLSALIVKAYSYKKYTGYKVLQVTGICSVW